MTVLAFRLQSSSVIIIIIIIITAGLTVGYITRSVSIIGLSFSF
jgi:hypothetical protein